ncbi:MAG: hypothetical protein DRG69_09945, partial [Deltaproteobacteria bacterium]
MSENALLDQPLVVQLLLQEKMLEEKDLPDVQQALNRFSGSVELALVHSNLATATDIARLYADHLHLPVIGESEEGDIPVNRELAERIGEKLCREKLVVPLKGEYGMLEVAFANPTDLTALEQIQMLTGMVIRPVVAPVTMITDALDEIFGKRDFVKEIASEVDGGGGMQEDDDDEAVEEIVDLDRPIPKGRDSHVIRLVNHILSTAVENGASDIHLEPFENSVRVRMRVDGKLHEISPPPRAMYVPMISRLKVLAKM